MIKYLLFLILSTNLYAANVLVLGDSHTAGPFGHELDKQLRAKGHTVGTYGSSSSIPGWFLDGTPTKWGFWSKDVNGIQRNVAFRVSVATPIFSTLMKQNPEIVIMAFGTNYATKSEKLAIHDMKRFLKELDDANVKCFWIAPPETRSFRDMTLKLYERIQKVVTPQCTIFESHKVTSYPATGGDGLHYPSAAGKKWAQKAAEAFNTLWQ